MQESWYEKQKQRERKGKGLGKMFEAVPEDRPKEGGTECTLLATGEKVLLVGYMGQQLVKIFSDCFKFLSYQLRIRGVGGMKCWAQRRRCDVVCRTIRGMNGFLKQCQSALMGHLRLEGEKEKKKKIKEQGLQGKQIMESLEHGDFKKAQNGNVPTSCGPYCWRLPPSLNSVKTSFIFLEESGETQWTYETLVSSLKKNEN